ncbi:methyltransferase domain-containing protein, partial [bacterium]|nr:methyltransferase domain-containing protein [bacterium]
MFLEESLKIRGFIEEHDPQSVTVLNLGSGDKHFREHVQPFVHKNVITPLEDRKCTVVNLDLYGSGGIDIRMDFSDLEQLRESYDIVMCCNVFEHVKDRKALAKHIVRLAKPGGHIVITTPHVFPYHLDPIDTLFRPTVQEHLDLFSAIEVLDS